MKRKISLILLVAICICICSIPAFSQQKDSEWVTVNRIAEGGLLKIITSDGKLKTIKLIGVDFPVGPEAQELSKNEAFVELVDEARKFAKTMLVGKRVRITYDKNRTDDSGNTLAYVWLNDGKLLNEEAIRSGFAYADFTYPYNVDYGKKFLQSQQYAIKNGLGLWNFSLAKEKESKDKGSGNFVPPTLTEPPGGDKVKVIKAIQGDTIEVKFSDGKTEKVRLIGVDTPETAYELKSVATFGKASLAYTKSHLVGQDVTLTYDGRRRTEEGELLAYVWKNGELFNNKIIREGYANIYFKYQFSGRYMKAFKYSQRYAILQQLGLWRKNTVDTSSYAKLKPPPVSQPSLVIEDNSSSKFSLSPDSDSFYPTTQYAPPYDYYSDPCFYAQPNRGHYHSDGRYVRPPVINRPHGGGRRR